MKLARYLLPLMLLANLPSVFLSAQEARDRGQGSDREREQREEDDVALRSFVQSKENIELEKKDKNLEISGDVRFEWNYLTEKGLVLFLDDNFSSSSSSGVIKGCPQRFSRNGFIFDQRYETERGTTRDIDTRGFPISNNDFDVEFNLKIKYTYGKAWMATHVQFDNPAGAKGNNLCQEGVIVCGEAVDVADSVTVIRNNSSGCKGSGEGSFLNLKRAYMGYNIWADGKHRFDIEIGRRKLDDIFDSEIQFGNRFDGILLKYASSIDEIADWFWDLGVFVIDERVNHFGYAFEFGFLNIFDTGLDLKYSYIDWTKRHRGKNRCFILDAIGSRFKTSQFTFSYEFYPELEFCCKSKKIRTELYGAFLINHAATKNVFSCHRKKNLGWYLGLYIGEVQKAGEWSVDIMYQYVQAQAVSDCDANGIERGNVLDEHFTDIYVFRDPVLAARTATTSGTGASDGSYSSSSSYFSSSSSDCFDRSAITVNELLNDLQNDPNVLAYILPGRGNTNFKGWKFEFLYALTDNLSIDTTYQFSRPEDSRIGGRHYYSDFEIEAIYAF